MKKELKIGNRVGVYKITLHTHWANFNFTWHQTSLREGLLSIVKK